MIFRNCFYLNKWTNLQFRINQLKIKTSRFAKRGDEFTEQKKFIFIFNRLISNFYDK